MGVIQKGKFAKGGALWNRGSGSKAGTLHPAPVKKAYKNRPSKALVKRGSIPSKTSSGWKL